MKLRFPAFTGMTISVNFQLFDEVITMRSHKYVAELEFPLSFAKDACFCP